MYPFNSLPDNARRKAWEESHPRSKEGSRSDLLDAARFDLRDSSRPYWTSLGPKPILPNNQAGWGSTSGRINSIAVKPDDPNVLLVGTSTGGIWRSRDGGATFDPVTDDQVDLAVGSIAFSPSNTSIVYAGMGDFESNRGWNSGDYTGFGILKSTDGGLHWIHINNSTLPSFVAVTKLTVDPTNSNRLWAAVNTFVQPKANYPGMSNFGGGLYLSSDGGANWTLTLGGVARYIAVVPANPRVLYGGIVSFGNGTPTAGVYRSTDGGLTWGSTPVYASPYGTNTRDVKIAVSATGATIWVSAGDNSSPNPNVTVADIGIGLQWSLNSNIFDSGQFGYNTYIAVDPANPNTVYVGSRDVWKMTRNGNSLASTNLTHNFTFQDNDWTFTPTQAFVHADQHAIAFSPVDPNVVFFGNDGGLYKSPDAGATFQSLNDTLTLTQFYSVSGPFDFNFSTDKLFFGGTQDNGLLQMVNGSTNWKTLRTGDYGNVVANRYGYRSDSENNNVFTANRAGVYRSDDLGQHFSQVATPKTFGEPETGGRIAFIPPFSGTETASTLYFGTSRLFISQNGGDTWFAAGLSADLTKGGTDVLSVIAVSSANPQVIYTGSMQGNVMVSLNGGETWTYSNGGLPDRSITGITVDQLIPAVAYLTVSGFLSGHVFKTDDYGAHWTDISGNLPDIPANASIIDSANRNFLYLGTDIGVFRYDAAGKTWSPFDNGLPPVVVTSFAAKAGLIRIGTWGRGAYELVGDSTGRVPAPSFATMRPEYGSVGQTVDVTLIGSDFVPGQTSVVVEGSGITVSAVNVIVPTLLTAKFTISPSAGPGARAVRVATTSGTSSEGFYFYVQVTDPPTLASVNPANGVIGKRVEVKMAGTNFIPGSTSIVAAGTGVTVESVKITNPTSLTAMLKIEPSAERGMRLVQIFTSNGVASGSFRIVGAPALTSMDLTSGSVGTNVNVTLTGLDFDGSNFVSGRTVVGAGDGITLSAVSVVSPTVLTATFKISPSARPGGRTITVTTPIGTSNAVTFTVDVTGKPTLAAVVPTHGIAGTSVHAKLTGTNFIPDATSIVVDGTGVTVASVRVTNPTELTATFQIEASAATGKRTVTVSTTNGTSGTQPFTVDARIPAIDTILPGSGGAAVSPLTVTLTGSNFIPGAGNTTVMLAPSTGVTIDTINVVSSSRLTAVFTIDRTAPAGSRTVTVKTSDGASLGRTFNVLSAVPAISTISPGSGDAVAPVNVTIIGRNFVAGKTSVTMNGTGVSVGTVNVLNLERLTTTFTIAAGAASGARTVTVQTPYGTATRIFSVVPAPGPRILKVSPASAVTLPSPVTITLNGANFVAGAGLTKVAISGSGITVGPVNVTSRTSLSTTLTIAPEAAIGRRDLTVTTPFGKSNVQPFFINSLAK